MEFTTENKHKAFMGHRKGLGPAKSFVGLRRIELKEDGDLEFEFYHRFNHINYFVKLGRVFADHKWQNARDNPYQAGRDAGERALNYYKNHAAPAVPFTKQTHNVDPDIVKWSDDIMETVDE